MRIKICDYGSVIFLLTIGVIVYVFIFEKKVEDGYENRPFRADAEEQVLPLLNTLPDKIVEFSLDQKKSLCKVDKRFLSFSIDSSQIYYGFLNPSLWNKKLRRTISHLKGGYLRVGGNAADMLVFCPAFKAWPDLRLPLDGGRCSYEKKNCPRKTSVKKFSMSAEEWNDLNDFCISTGLKLLFDINILLRDSHNDWNSSNCELLLDISYSYHYEIDWQLGNEPNCFKHLFGVEVKPKNLAKDFNTLKKLLHQYTLYNSSIVVGPDVTNPHHGNESPEAYLLEFLKANPNIDAVSWHQYYTGPDVSLEDFLNVETYEQFIESYSVILEAIKNSNISQKPVWLTETGTSYGGGAQNLSDRFVGSFLWLDKLGLSAKAGISVVVRQSLYRGHYGLLHSEDLSPNPDYWVSILHKHLVRETVLNLTSVSKSYDKTLRAYAQCSTENKVVIFGVNIANISQGLYLPLEDKGHLYCLHSDELQSRSLKLNGYELLLGAGESLPYFKPILVDLKTAVNIPPYSMFFIQVNMVHPACLLG